MNEEMPENPTTPPSTTETTPPVGPGNMQPAAPEVSLPSAGSSSPNHAKLSWWRRPMVRVLAVLGLATGAAATTAAIQQPSSDRAPGGIEVNVGGPTSHEIQPIPPATRAEAIPESTTTTSTTVTPTTAFVSTPPSSSASSISGTLNPDGSVRTFEPGTAEAPTTTVPGVQPTDTGVDVFKPSSGDTTPGQG